MEEYESGLVMREELLLYGRTRKLLGEALGDKIAKN